MRSALELRNLDPEFALAAAVEAATATSCSWTQKTGMTATGRGFASTTAAAVALKDDDNVARMRSLTEQERQIVSRVLGADKTSVWQVCQSLRDASDAHQFEPNFDFPTSGALGFSAASASERRTLQPTSHQRLLQHSSRQPPTSDQKSRLSVARTQEAAPCCRSREPGSNRRQQPQQRRQLRATKLAEKVIDRYRRESSAANGQVAVHPSRQPGESSGTADHQGKINGAAVRQPVEEAAAESLRGAAAESLRGAAASAATTASSTETLRSVANSFSCARLPQQQQHQQEWQSLSTLVKKPSSLPLGAAAQPATQQQAPPLSSIRSRIRFLPLAAALSRSGFAIDAACKASQQGVDEDDNDDEEYWDPNEVDIRRLTRRRRLDRLMSSQLAEQGIRTITRAVANP